MMHEHATVWTGTAASFPEYADEPDLALVVRTRQGELEAFSELVRRHQRLVYNLAYRFMRDAGRAEDMAQEAFLKAFRLLKGFRGDSSFSTWMYRVACNVCLTELTRDKRHAEISYPTGYENLVHVVPSAPTDEFNYVREAVTKLPHRYATVVTLYYLHELSYEEIAQILHISIGTLKTWLHRARKNLRKIIEKGLK